MHLARNSQATTSSRPVIECGRIRYELDFDAMTQTNLTTGRCSRMRRGLVDSADACKTELEASAEAAILVADSKQSAFNDEQAEQQDASTINSLERMVNELRAQLCHCQAVILDEQTRRAQTESDAKQLLVHYQTVSQSLNQAVQSQEQLRQELQRKHEELQSKDSKIEELTSLQVKQEATISSLHEQMKEVADSDMMEQFNLRREEYDARVEAEQQRDEAQKQRDELERENARLIELMTEANHKTRELSEQLNGKR